MVWNQPSNNENNSDPWKSSGRSNGNGGNNEKGPPDLEDIFRKILKKLSIFNYSNKNNSIDLFGKNRRYIGLAIIMIIFSSWTFSGFYTIKEAERGVVLRFGKFSHLVQPGLNWKPTFIDTVTAVNVESVRELAASGVMLTSDENVLGLEMNVQYRIIDPKCYLFSVINADDSLRQAADSALRGVIGKYSMDKILTEGRTVVRSDTQRILEETIHPYNMGITLLDVNFQAARPPEEVKAAFDDVIAARENEQQYIREAEAYANEVQPRANGKAQRILEEGRAYKTRTILEAQGEVQRFSKILEEYKISPDITKKRLYIDSMERILSNTSNIIINDQNKNSLLVLPIDKLLHRPVLETLKNGKDYESINKKNISIIDKKNDILNKNNNRSISTNNYSVNQKRNFSSRDNRQTNVQRNDTTREGRK